MNTERVANADKGMQHQEGGEISFYFRMGDRNRSHRTSGDLEMEEKSGKRSSLYD